MTTTPAETDNLPDVPRDADLARWRTVGYWLALAESGDESAKAKGAGAALRLFYASELGLPPLAAAELSVIHGRVYVGAKLLRALAARHGYRVKRLESDAEHCVAAVVDTASGEELGRTTYTMEEARTGGLVRDRGAWKTHPARMLWARASKYALDDYAPEVTLGIYTEDEKAEITGEPLVVEDADWEDAKDIPFGEPAAEEAPAAEGKP